MVRFKVKECDLTDNATSASQNDDGLRDKKLKLAGYSYLLGDAALAASGLAQGKGGREVFGTGAIWAAGAVGAAVWGNPTVEKQLEILGTQIASRLQDQGATLTDATRSDIPLLKNSQGMLNRLDHFLYKHPTELLNSAYAIGSAILLHGGIKNFSQTKGKIHAAMGGLVMAGALGGLLIKEDPNARKKADQNSFLSRTTAFIKEKPMRFSGTMYWVNNIFTVANAVSDRKLPAGKFGLRPHWFSVTTAASYILANGLLFMSPRDQIAEQGFAGHHIAELEDAAARIIAAQPVHIQQALLSDISHYMAEEKGIKLPPEQIAQALANRITEITGERAQQAANAVSWVEREKSRLGTAHSNLDLG